MSSRLTHAMGMLAGRLAQLLGRVSPEHPLAQSRAFLLSKHEAAVQAQNSDASAGKLERPSRVDAQPVDLLAARFGLSEADIELLLLAAMPDEHEGYSAVMRALHPSGESRATAGLAAQLLFGDTNGRERCRQTLEQGALFRSGIVRLSGDGPFFDRSLRPAENLWSALHGIDSWPPELVPIRAAGDRNGLERWLAGAAARRAVQALRENRDCTVAVKGDDSLGAVHRAAALVREAGRVPVAVTAPIPADGNWQRLLSIHAALRDAVPVVRISAPVNPVVAEDPGVFFAPGPIVVSGPDAPGAFARGRSLISVPMQPLAFADRCQLWSSLAPALNGSIEQLASRYPLEPYRVAETADDLRLMENLEERMATAADVAETLRSRAHRGLNAGVKLVHPHATWEDLILPCGLITQLHEAVDRVVLQSRVLDNWGFLRNRGGARGVRVLFSGPPGTGKTLSAEVLARALDADLLVVDVSRVMSKWIGETEKNLASVFDAAENSQTVLLFDEADALFAKRTDVSDANDRYANLETAYLLQRLERFEGLAILATNLRQNIDAAFVRRLEFVLDFSEPDREQRIALWKRHIPADAPIDPEFKWYELAAAYSVVGGVIRNAAVAAAFLAAAEGAPICREHFIHAIRREYEKAGKAFPGLPAGMKI
jgi:SpoVK/Ycf46/Vps4 family AAA+-type ATPase